MKILHLVLKGEYFDAIKRGEKPFDYRLKDDYWIQKLINREYDEIHFQRGYPQKDDDSKIIKTQYRGFEMQTITHEDFGSDAVEVFAIHAATETKMDESA